MRCAISLALLLLAACGGGGGSGGTGGTGGGPAPPGPPPATTVTVSGRITFDYVPFGAANNAGLNFSPGAIQQRPARAVTVEAVSPAGAVLAGTTTDANGQYSVTVNANTELFIRAKAEMRRSGTPAWNFSVRDNTSTDSLYALDGTTFNSGSANATRDLNAGSGWGGSSYTGTRAAAPFAILDAVYLAYTMVQSADANVVFPDLQLMWSTRNVPAGDNSTAALARGEINTTFFRAGGGSAPDRIYILGAADNDTDEFDPHVIAHEWGHYYQDNFSRDDSIGGSHSLSDRLDARVAFSEGWGNAFAGMAKGDPLYRDSFGSSQGSGFSINVESNPAGTASVGWFGEGSVQSLFYDFFDSGNESSDTLALGFGPIHAAMTGAVRTTPAFTTIYPFVSALRAQNGAQAAAINALLAAQNIAMAADDFGSGEANNGGDARNVPLYGLISSGQTRRVCSSSTLGTYNKLGNRRFLRLDLGQTRNLSFAATIVGNATGTDPDVVVHNRGAIAGIGESTVDGSEVLTLNNQPAGTYIIELYEYSNVDTAGTPRGDTCFDLQLTTS